MMNRNHLSLALRSKTRQRLLLAVAAISLAGCSSMSSLLEDDRIDYKSAGKAPSLEVPPDLTQLQRENRYAIPDNRGTATASGYSMTQKNAPSVATNQVIAPKATAEMRIERAGNQRWLVVKQPPEALWPQIKDFWQEAGFLINLDTPETGVMETDWAENRAKIPQDIFRRTVGRALDSLYSTGERDKFRTRLERGADGSTEIYISHRGAQEVLTGSQRDSTVWTPRQPDPELEAEFLGRLMARLGTEGNQARAAVANANTLQPRAKLVKSGEGAYVEVDEGFDRAWRRVGLALDRVGFTVEDRDRAQGVYFVRYLDQNQEANNSPEAKKGFFSKLFSFGSSDDPKKAQRYRVSVKGSEASSRVAVQNNDGRSEVSQTADRILGLLNDQLK